MKRVALWAIVTGAVLAERPAALEIGTRDGAVLRIGVVDMDRVMERAPAVRALQDECRAVEQEKQAALESLREQLRTLSAQRIAAQAAMEGYRNLLSSTASPFAVAPPATSTAAASVAHSSGIVLPSPPPPSIVVPVPQRDAERSTLEEQLARTRAMIADLDRAIAERTLQQSSSRGRTDVVKIQQEVQEYRRRRADAEREAAELETRLAAAVSTGPDGSVSSGTAPGGVADMSLQSREELQTRLTATQVEVNDLSARIEMLSRTIADRERAITGEVAEFRQRRECEILAGLYEAVKAVALREGLNVVIEKSGILYGAPEVDITEQVIHHVLR